MNHQRVHPIALPVAFGFIEGLHIFEGGFVGGLIFAWIYNFVLRRVID